MLRKILLILSFLVEAIKKRQKKKEQQQHEKQSRDIEKDPANWLDQHFNGDGHSVRNDTDLPDNAADAGKADSTKLDNK